MFDLKRLLPCPGVVLKDPGLTSWWMLSIARLYLSHSRCILSKLEDRKKSKCEMRWVTNSKLKSTRLKGILMITTSQSKQVTPKDDHISYTTTHNPIYS